MYVDSPTIPGLLDQLEAIPRPPGTTLMVLFASQDPTALKTLAKGLQQRNIAAFGAHFPGLVANGQWQDRGAIGIALPLLQPPQLVGDHDPSEIIIRSKRSIDDSGKQPTALIFFGVPEFDIHRFKRLSFDHWGPSVNYLGAGAGNHSFASDHCVFSGSETALDGAVLAMIDMSCSLNLNHGWKPIAGPMVATRCEGNRIIEINWESAYPVYRDALPASLRIRDHEEFIERVSRQHPLAIAQADGGEPVIRIPIKVDPSGSLLMAAEVRENATLYIAQAEPGSLEQAAKELPLPLRATASNTRAQLLVSCIARKTLFGQDRFEQEIGLIQQGTPVPLLGVTSLAEIASTGDRYFAIHNKAMALARFHA